MWCYSICYFKFCTSELNGLLQSFTGSFHLRFFSCHSHTIGEGGIDLSAWIWGMLISQYVLAAFMYLWLFRRKKLIDFHIGMNTAMVVGGGLALGTGVLLIYEFPFDYMVVTGIATLTGMGAGGLFGSLFGKQTMLSGYVCGLMTGMMAPMVGAAAFFSIPFAVMIELFIVCSFMFVMKETFHVQVNDDRSEK